MFGLLEMPRYNSREPSKGRAGHRPAGQTNGNPMLPPVTIIVRHPKENPRKCSVMPLKGRPDVLFLGYPVVRMPPLGGYVRLAADGPELSEADVEQGILLLDASWRWADSMEAVFVEVPQETFAPVKTIASPA